MTVALSLDPSAAQDFYTAHRVGFAAIAPERRAAHAMLLINLLHLYERAYIQREAGRLGDDAWEAIRRGNAVNIIGNAAQEIWQRRKASFATDFVAYLDNEIASAPQINYTPWYAAGTAPARPASSASQSAQP